jgi:polysaccharide export outer membrane protein
MKAKTSRCGFRRMKEHKAALCGPALTLLCLLLCCASCSRDYLDPTQLGRFRPVPVVNVILDSLGVVDEPQERYAGAQDPRPEDVIPYEQDLVIGNGDVVRINIYELFSEGRPFVNDFMVTETGRISIPEVGQVRAAGLTEARLEEEIRNILSPSVLKDPSVSVMVMSSQSRIYSISGQGVRRPGRFSIPRRNYRLLDAIAQAGGVGQFNISNIYVSREITGEEAIIEQVGEMETVEEAEREDAAPKPVEPDRGDEGLSPEEEMLEIIAPYARGGADNGGIIIALSEMITDEELEALATPEGLQPETKSDVDDEATPAEEVADSVDRRGETERIEWVFEDGRWLPIRVGPAPEAERKAERVAEELKGPLPPGEERAEPFGLEQIGAAGAQVRIIKIPVDKLLGGDPRYNVMVRPGDTITVPVDLIGEFWVMGNVRGSGPVNLTGRPMTLKMAIATAGGLNALAWPKNVEVIRRVGQNKEVTVMVNLDKIAKGLQPDFFIKPYDLINVGTHGISRYAAVLRNAFGASYGFSFNFGRNFAARDFGYGGIPRYNTLGEALDDFKGIF